MSKKNPLFGVISDCQTSQKLYHRRISKKMGMNFVQMSNVPIYTYIHTINRRTNINAMTEEQRKLRDTLDN